MPALVRNLDVVLIAELGSQRLGGISAGHIRPCERGTSIALVAQRFKQTVTQADYLVRMKIVASSDVSPLLSQVRVPTLVLHPRDSMNMSPDASMELAARIPGAQMMLIEGATVFGDHGPGLAAIEDFLASLDASHEPKAPDVTVVEPTGLSTREVEVLRLISAGRSNQQIADELVLSIRTVERHVTNIYGKIGAANRAQAAVYAKDHHIV